MIERLNKPAISTPDSSAAVGQTREPAEDCWIARPNQSLSWTEAFGFVALLAAVTLSIGLWFLFQGYPLVLPFSGLEVLAVAAAFYIVLRRSEWREVISFTQDVVIVEKGYREPSERAEFQRSWVQVQLERSAYRLHPTRLHLGSHGRRVELGKFLTDGEREELAQELINALGKKR